MSKTKAIAAAICFCLAAGAATARADIMIDTGGILFNQSLSKKDKAEQLARNAELLSQTNNVDFAARLIKHALQLDPTNLRAQMVQREIEMSLMFYELAARTKWIGSRLKGEFKKTYDSQVETLMKCAECARIFTAQKEPPFKTGEEIREFFKRVLRKIDEQIAFVTRNQNQSIELTKFDAGYRALAGEYEGQSCPTREISPNVFVIESCENQSLQVLKVDRHDWVAMKYELLNQKMKLILALAYSQDDLPGILTRISELPQERLTLKNLAAIVRSSPRFLRLVDRQSLKQLRFVGAEGAFIFREMANAFKCVDGQTTEIREDHKYGTGFCGDRDFPFFEGRFAEKTRAPFKFMFKVIKDFALDDPSEDPTIAYETELDLRPALNGEISTLQSFIPNSFDKCGKPMSFIDPTLNRTLPRGDLMTVVSSYRRLREKLAGENLQCRP